MVRLRIVSWNVNGIRASTRKGFADWLAHSDADIVALQEVRARPDQVPKGVTEQTTWTQRWVDAQRPGYSGVGVLSKLALSEPAPVLTDPQYVSEGRLVAAQYGDLLLVNGYFPNGSGRNRDHSRVPYKLGFYRALFDALATERAAGRPILVMGDFNTAHREIDLARPKSNRKTSGFLDIEREELERWLRSGWTDTFRHIHGDVVGAYTWWSQRGNCRQRNVGWRIDYVLASPSALPLLEDAFIWPEVMGSDHCPIGLDLQLEAL
ncbi:MAG TPA: exodeoxyribonuclease III, partial [Myxococcales bacterium]|nr:exodeoxyribonuclease III [Myxococcales bacterium]